MQKINQVLKTNDYSLFGHLKGNRDINPPHLARLKKSISEQYLEVPIIINEKNEIIDGQHRFESAKSLNKPIYFIRIKGLGLDEVHRLNTNSKNWTAEEYMNGYCELGYGDYLLYRQFKNKYGFGHNETITILKGGLKISGGNFEDFRDGKFKIHDYELGIEIAEKLKMIGDFYDGYKRRAFIYAMLKLFRNDQYNHVQFLQKLSYQSNKLQDTTNVKLYLQMIEEIYNYKRPKSDKVRFY